MTSRQGTRAVRRATWAALGAMLAVWSLTWGHGAEAAMPIDQRTIPLKPGLTFVKTAFLTGELRDLRVVEHVERDSGRLVGTPMLQGMLTLRNDSMNETAQLMGGKVLYLNGEGQHIEVPRDAGSTTFPIFGSVADHLAPGQEISLSIEVPYPAAALMPGRIREVGLELTYTTIPYHQNVVTFPVVLGG